MTIREMFESKFPLPSGINWDGSIDSYYAKVKAKKACAEEYNLLWRGFKKALEITGLTDSRVFHNGKLVTVLNLTLAKSQKLNLAQLEALKATHRVRHVIFAEAKKTKDSRKLKTLAKVFEELEFIQQELWGFKKDKNYHRWFDLPGCTCPKYDNSEVLGSDIKYINGDCPVHAAKPVRRNAKLVQQQQKKPLYVQHVITPLIKPIDY